MFRIPNTYITQWYVVIKNIKLSFGFFNLFITFGNILFQIGSVIFFIISFY
jgi:hypothetical protein